jgi:N4-gp56 family major capsid protein
MANTTSINSELFANLVTQAQFAAYENSVARQLVSVFDAPVNAGKVLQVPVWSSIAAELITDESAANAKNTNTTSASITLKEHVVYHQVTDMLRDSSYSNVVAQLGDQSGRAIAESMDTQVFAEFSNLTGAGGTAIALASFGITHIMDRVAALRANKLTGPFFAVIHPTAANALKKALTGTTAYTANTNLGNDILSNYFVDRVAGCTIIESSLVPYASGTGIATCAVFAPSALGHAMRGTLEMETQRQAAARATDVVMKAVAGAATLQATHGYALEIDLVA